METDRLNDVADDRKSSCEIRMALQMIDGSRLVTIWVMLRWSKWTSFVTDRMAGGLADDCEMSLGKVIKVEIK